MKRLMALMAAVLLLAGVAGAEETADFAALTGMDQARKLLEDGAVIEKVFYTDGYGFSVSEFETADPEEIRALWEALGEIEAGSRVNEDITDWYPQIIFYFSDGTNFGVRFDAHWLEIGGMEHYELVNAEGFWYLTRELVQKYSPEEY